MTAGVSVTTREFMDVAHIGEERAFMTWEGVKGHEGLSAFRNKFLPTHGRHLHLHPSGHESFQSLFMDVDRVDAELPHERILARQILADAVEILPLHLVPFESFDGGFPIDSDYHWSRFHWRFHLPGFAGEKGEDLGSRRQLHSILRLSWNLFLHVRQNHFRIAEIERRI